MVRIVFRRTDGALKTISATPGFSLMQVAKGHDVEGIEAECGGSMVCGTCQVYVPNEWRGLVGEATPMEAEMLEFVAHPRADGRLACQIEISIALDGLMVETPPSQR